MYSPAPLGLGGQGPFLLGVSVAHLIQTLPMDDRTNGWSKLLPPRTPSAALTGNRRFDWVIVGAGYAGLAAARRIAINRPSDSVALIDAGGIGENASGRNSGFAIDLPHNHTDNAESVEQTRRAIRVGRYALNELDTLIKEHRIPCNWSQRGKYHAAATDAIASSVLRPYMSDLERWGETYEFVERSQLKERLGTSFYSAAVYTPGTFLVNPAALCRGLAESLPSNITLFENSPVTEYEFEGERRYVRTSQGSIEFGNLILTVNAFASQFGVFKNRQIPIVLFASLTAPLSQAQRAELGSEQEWGITPAHGVAGSTLRLTQDHRLLIRHGFEYSPSFRCSEVRRQRAMQLHRELLAKRFPAISGMSIEHFWMGWLSVSQNQAPAFGKISKHVFAAACCNGVGIVRHTAAGTLIGDLATGAENALIDDFIAQGSANLLPPRPFVDVGVKAKLMWEMYQGRQEA